MILNGARLEHKQMYIDWRECLKIKTEIQQVYGEPDELYDFLKECIEINTPFVIAATNKELKEITKDGLLVSLYS